MWTLCNQNGELLTIPAVMRGEKLHRFVRANNVGIIEPIGYLKQDNKPLEDIVKRMVSNSLLIDVRMQTELENRAKDLVNTINSDWFGVDVKRRFGTDICAGMPWSVTVAPNCIVLEVRKKFKGNSIITIGENAESVHGENRKTVRPIGKKIGRPATKLVMLAKQATRSQDIVAPVAEKIGNMMIKFISNRSRHNPKDKNLTDLIENAKKMISKSRKEINDIRSGK